VLLVAPVPPDLWRVDFAGTEETIEFFPKGAAVAFASASAKTLDSCEVHIQNDQGTLEKTLVFFAQGPHRRRLRLDRRRMQTTIDFEDRRMVQRRKA
jgi:hypothetical protein